MLQVRHLRKAFGELVAVDDISFDVAEGECFGLLGPNGAGKSTAITMLVGATSPDGGEAILDGDAIHLRAFGAKRKIGYVPQEIGLYEMLDCRANLRFFGALYGLTGAVLNTATDRVLATVGLQDRDREPVANFSGGMKRRLNIACALMHQPKLLVLDEPTVGVDPQSRNAIFDCLDALRAEGMALIYTTHYMEEVERLCQRVAIMDNGSIIAEESIANIRKLLPQTNEVVVELEGNVSKLTAALPGTQRQELNETTLTLEIADLNRDLPRALMALSDLGIRYQSVRTQEGTLEEVFLHLTGKTLRD